MVFIASYQQKNFKQKNQDTFLKNQSGKSKRSSQKMQYPAINRNRRINDKASSAPSLSNNKKTNPGNYRCVSENVNDRLPREAKTTGDYRTIDRGSKRQDSWMISPVQGGQTSNASRSNMQKKHASKGRPQQKKRSRKKRLNPMTRLVLLVIGVIILLVFIIEGIAAIRHSKIKEDTAMYSSTSSSVTSPVSEEQDQQSESTYPEGTDPLTLGSMTQLVNKTHGLPTDYEPSDLVKNELPGMRDTYLRSEAATALSELFVAAESAGVSLICCSGYRSYESQTEVYASEVANLGEYEAYMTTAPPGYSEHQTGLCIDVTSDSVNQTLTTDFINTAEGIWLDENAWRFGFIIRYPNGMEDITGYTYEPWHIRYLGKEVAKAVYESGKTYEEYLGILD